MVVARIGWTLAMLGLAASLCASCSMLGGSEGDPGPIESMLAFVPDVAEHRSEIVVNDYVAAIGALGRERPAPGDQVAVDEYVRDLVAGDDPPLFTNPIGFDARAHEVDEWRTELGFSILDADRDVLAGQPPDELFVVQTSLQPSDIEEALRRDPTWGGELEEVSYAGGTYFTWSDPLALHVERSSAPRPLGEGGALAALDGGAVIRAVDPRVVERALDALSGTARSLADDEGAVAVARALDGAGAHTALLTDRLSPPDPAELLDVLNEEVGSLEEAAERLERLPTLPAYRVLGIGQALDADGNGLLVVAFATATPEEAEAVADAFTAVVEDGVSIVGDRPWSELLSIRSTSLDETTATIVLDTDNPRLGLQAFYAHDTLFATG